MRTGKLALAVCVCAVLAATSSCRRGTTTQGGRASVVDIAVITPLSHPSLDQTIEGFKAGLAESNYSGNVVRIRAMNANGDFANIPSLVKAAVAQKPRLVFVLTTPASADAVKLTDPARIPLVYAAVTDPVGAKIVTAMDRSDTLATGVSDRYPVEEQVATFLRIHPQMRRAALVYNPKEQNSQILVTQTIAALGKNRVQGRRYEVLSESEIASQTKRALAECDCIIVNGDNLVTENLPAVINLCVRAKRPLFVGDPDSVRKGAIATVGPSYFELGRIAGHQAAQVLDGKPVGSIPSQYPESFDYIVNVRAATSMGITIPPSYWQTRDIWESRAAASR